VQISSEGSHSSTKLLGVVTAGASGAFYLVAGQTVPLGILCIVLALTIVAGKIPAHAGDAITTLKAIFRRPLPPIPQHVRWLLVLSAAFSAPMLVLSIYYIIMHVFWNGNWPFLVWTNMVALIWSGYLFVLWGAAIAPTRKVVVAWTLATIPILFALALSVFVLTLHNNQSIMLLAFSFGISALSPIFAVRAIARDYAVRSPS